MSDPSQEEHIDDVYAENNAYFRALGEFIHNFAALEGLMQQFLASQAGVDINIGKAVFSDFKFEKVRDLLKRIRETRSIEEDKQLKATFDQINQINVMRNLLVHYGAYRTDGGFRVTTWRKGYSPSCLRQYMIQIKHMEAMTQDVRHISATLVAYFAAQRPTKSSAADEEMKAGFMKSFRNLASVPWQYKPVLPSQIKKPFLANPTRRKRQRDT